MPVSDTKWNVQHLHPGLVRDKRTNDSHPLSHSLIRLYLPMPHQLKKWPEVGCEYTLPQINPAHFLGIVARLNVIR